MWHEIGAKRFAISERPMSLYDIGSFLVPLNARLLRSYEVQRLRAEGFQFGDLEITGIFWTATRVSCSLNCAWEISEGGEAQPVKGGWDKTFMAWVVAVPK